MEECNLVIYNLSHRTNINSLLSCQIQTFSGLVFTMPFASFENILVKGELFLTQFHISKGL